MDKGSTQYTREQILAMEPGRELDALVAEEVIYPEDDDNGTVEEIKEWCLKYSTDISAAWDVKNKIRDYPFDHPIRRAFYNNIVELSGGDYADVEPHHIAKSALLAVMGL